MVKIGSSRSRRGGGGDGTGDSSNIGGGDGVIVVVKGRRDQGRRRRTGVMQFPVEEEVDDEVMPGWLRGLMGETTFFAGCGDHEDRRKNEKNIFCLCCCLSICQHCLPHHRSHPLLQVRRYVYHDVVRLIDLQKLIDCFYIQPYTINGAKVIFLNERAQARSYKGANACFTCDRILQHSFRFCSLSCKVDHMLREGRDLSRILYRIQQSDFAYTQFEGEEASEDMDDDDDAQITDSSMVDLQGEMEANDDEQMDDPLLDFKPSLACSSHHHHDAISTLPLTSVVGNGDGNEMPMKQKKGRRGFMPGIVLSLNSCRRKGAPQRSPLS
ncbi:hypothetical protein Droror1_Dr00017803 [Drosera rotundifolia]